MNPQWGLYPLPSSHVVAARGFSSVCHHSRGGHCDAPTTHIQTSADAFKIRPSPGCHGLLPRSGQTLGAASPWGRCCPPRAAGAHRKLCKTLLGWPRSAAGPPLYPPPAPSPASRAQSFAPLVRMLGSRCQLGAVGSLRPGSGDQILRWAGTRVQELVGAVLEPREGRSRGMASAAARSPAGAAGGAEAGAGAVEPSQGQRSRSARPLHFSA